MSISRVTGRDVRALVNRFGGSGGAIHGQFGSGPMHVEAGNSSGFPHGSAEQGRPRPRGRNRSRDHANRMGHSQPVELRHSPVGPQETMEWDDVITDLNDRILALENHNLAHGQSIAQILGNFNIMNAKLETLLMPSAEDIPLY